MSNIVGQVVCECGRIAHVKRRSNGRKLPFKHCKKCGVDMTSNEERRQMFLDTMKENIGVFGEFLSEQKSDSERNISEATGIEATEKEMDIHSNENGTDWKPEEEVVAAKQEADEDEETTHDSNMGLAGWGLAILAAGGVLFGLSQATKPRG